MSTKSILKENNSAIKEKCHKSNSEILFQESRKHDLKCGNDNLLEQYDLQIFSNDEDLDTDNGSNLNEYPFVRNSTSAGNISNNVDAD